MIVSCRAVASRMLSTDSPPGVPSEFIRHLDTLTLWLEDLPIWLHVRVSGRTQNLSRSLDRQVVACLSALTSRGLVVSGITREVSSGWKADDRSAWRYTITQARVIHAIIVGETTDRLLRPENYNSESASDAVPSVADLEWLKGSVQRRIVATILPPDIHPSEVRSYQTKRG
jgi:hypothetical protein